MEKKIINKKYYNENGYLIINNFILKNKIHDILNKLNAIICNSLKKLEINNYYDIYYEENIINLSIDKELYYSTFIIENLIENILHENLKILFNFSKDIYLDVIKSFRRIYDIYELFINNEIKSLLKDLEINFPSIPTETVLHMDSNYLIINPEYVIFPPHQDFTANPSSLDSIVIWIPLTNITNNSFPLEIYPKTHLNGIYKGNLNKNSYVADIDTINIKPLCINMNIGDILIFSQFLIHNTKFTDDYKGLRIATSFRYDNHNEETFIERKYCNNYYRGVNRQEPNLNFPTSNYLINKIFN